MSWDGSVIGSVDHSKEADELARAREEYEKISVEIDNLNSENDKALSVLSEINQGWEEQAEAARRAADESSQAALSEEEMVSEAWGSIQSDLEALCASYDEAYDHALSSIEGQYDLWEKAADLSNVTKDDLNSMMDDLNSALDSQINYWETYSSSIENLSGRNIDGLSAMVASMDDGSEKSAAALQAMASASDDELQAMVSKYGDLQSAQQQTASDTANLKTNFNSELDQMQAKMEETVSKMNDSGGAASAAKSTMSAYISELKAKGNEAVSEAQSIASRISAALSKAKGSTSVTTHVVGRATGTVSAQEDVFLAGEEGPELIVGHRGSEVFPAGETNRIIDAISGREQYAAPKAVTPETSLTGYDSAISDLSATVSAATQSIPEALERAVSDVTRRESVQTGADTGRFGSLIDNLLSGFAGAFSATADGISDNAFDKLEDSITAVSAFATGTTNAPDAYIAGDEGPELILGAAGSEVFPTGETDRLIDALTPSDASDALTGETAPLRTEGLSRPFQYASDGQQPAGGEAERRVVIEIAGSGAISVEGGANTEEIVRVIQDNLEPVLIGILQDEIFEQGDESYEF